MYRSTYWLYVIVTVARLTEVIPGEHHLLKNETERDAGLNLASFSFTEAMKEYAKGFYKSTAWQRCRANYFAYRKGLCEECLKAGEVKAGVIVHHKRHINPDNIKDPTITLNFDNLELLCELHHAEKHNSGHARRYAVNIDGSISPRY